MRDDEIGLLSLEANKPLPISVPRAKGFDMGIVAVLEKPEDVATYAVHPVHLEYVDCDSLLLHRKLILIGSRVSKFREELCNDTLAYDLEF